MILDLVDRQVVEPSFWTRVRSRYKEILVRTAEDPDAYVEDRDLEIVLTDYEGESAPLRLKLDYEARCMPAHARTLVEALGPESDPRAEVHRRLRRWVEEFARERRESFVDELQAHSQDLKRELKDRAVRQLGLTLKLKIRLVGQDSLVPYEVGPREIAVRIQDHRPKLKVRFEVSYPVARQALGRAAQHLSQLERLDTRTMETVIEVLENETTLHQFYRDLDGVAGTVRARLEPLAHGWGREVGHLHLEAVTPLQGVLESFESKHEFSRTLAEYPEPIQIRTGFLLVLQDVGQYLAAGSPPLETWARQAVEEAARQVLFAARYSELVRHVDDKKAEIKRRMAQQAAVIGYDIRQFIAITNLQVDQLREPFAVITKESFPTRMPEVLAGLEIQTTCRIPDMTKIESLLDRRENVIAAMSAAVRDHVAAVLFGVDPEEFYLYFETPMPPRNEARLPVVADDPLGAGARQAAADGGRPRETLERRLRAGIKNVLSQTFGAEVSGVVFKESGDAIGARLRNLRRRSQKFEVTVEPKGGRHLPAVFEFSVLVDAVDPRGWQRFLARQPDMDTLVATLQTALSGRLAEVVPEELYNLNAAQMLGQLNEWAAGRLGWEFGLDVKITDISRQLTEEERKRREVIEAALRADAEIKLGQIEHAVSIAGEQRGLAYETARRLRKEFETIEDRLLSAADLDHLEKEQLLRRKEEIKREMALADKRPDGMDLLESVRNSLGVSADEAPPRRSLAPQHFNHVSMLEGSSTTERPE